MIAIHKLWKNKKNQKKFLPVLFILIEKANTNCTNNTNGYAEQRFVRFERFVFRERETTQYNIMYN